MNFGRYKLFLAGIVVIALGAIVDMGEFTRVTLVVGWGLIIVGTIRRMKYRR